MQANSISGSKPEVIVGRKNRRAGILAGVLVFLLMAYWYQFSAKPLHPAEIEHYMAVYQAQTRTHDVRHDMAALRLFLEQDDGLPFYTVNLYKFHDQAAYPAGSLYGGSGAQAYDRFSETMVKLFAARASHPIFGSSWSEPTALTWDRIVIVRYRSRRDIADLFATDAFAEASTHKWAAIRGHERMLVQGVHLPNGLVLAFGLAFIVALAVNALASIVRLKRPAGP